MELYGTVRNHENPDTDLGVRVSTPLGRANFSGARVAGRSEPDGVVALPISLFQQIIPGTTPLLGYLESRCRRRGTREHRAGVNPIWCPRKRVSWRIAGFCWRVPGAPMIRRSSDRSARVPPRRGSAERPLRS